MSQTPSSSKNDDNEGSGPRPRPPGQESRTTKMTEGVSESSSIRNSPPWCHWARNLSNLLEDGDGVKLLIKYVEEENPMYNDTLNFYFACEGLKQQTDPGKIKPIIGAIYRKYLRKDCQIKINDNFRQKIKTGLKSETQLHSNIFDSIQKDVEKTIRDSIFPNFLSSEIYLKYVREMSQITERHSGSSGASSVSGGAEAGTCSSIVASTLSSILSTTGPPIVAGTSSGVAAAASGSFYGPSTSASSSGSISATDTLPRSTTLPTLHEDSELSVCDNFENFKLSDTRIAGGGNCNDIPMRLTRDLLLATQNRRLEIRPPGAHGYFSKPNLSASYNPCSRVDSERASVSSGGRTDSDTMSMSSCSKDGRPYIQKRNNNSESKAIRHSANMNKEATNLNCQFIPRPDRIGTENRPFKAHDLMKILIPKLEAVKRQQELEERLRPERELQPSSFGGSVGFPSEREICEAIRKLAPEEDNDQDILDQHVSRVFETPHRSPYRSPGTMSPRPPLPSRRRTTTQDSGMLSDTPSSGHSMRHSKSMPEHSSSTKRLTNKWPSMNTDSGISLFSADTTIKYKDTTSRPASSMVCQQEDNRRSRRYQQSASSSAQAIQPSFSSSSSGSSSLHQPPPLPMPQYQQQPPPLPAKPQETTTVLITFGDEEIPYRTKIPGTQPTLKLFKEYLPKKGGNFRYFFKTHCEDPDSPVIQEEIVNDSDILPLFEGKVMGLVKPSD